MRKFKGFFFSTILLAAIFCFVACGDDDGSSGSPSLGVTFTKANNADSTLEANQDRITNNVWLTRGNNKGLYNAATETEYDDFSSPADTEWAFGTTSNLTTLTFNNWETTIDSEPIDLMLDKNMVIHLITDNIYLDIKFAAWTVGPNGGGPGGGGFTYMRSEIE